MTRTVPVRARNRTVQRFTFAGRGCRDPRREPRRRRQYMQPGAASAPPAAEAASPPTA